MQRTGQLNWVGKIIFNLPECVVKRKVLLRFSSATGVIDIMPLIIIKIIKITLINQKLVTYFFYLLNGILFNIY